MFSFERNLDLTGCEKSALEPLVSVIDTILSKTNLTTSQFMIVGAEARNLLHTSFGQHPGDLATTRDIDVALAMPNWSGFEQLSPVFPLIDSRKSAIRFNIEDVPVDVIPFGGLEDPKGIVVAPEDGHQINVLGYTRAFEAADKFQLPHVGEVLVVSPSYYVIFKLEALADRSKWHKTKDAQDIGTALHWVEVAAGAADWVYESEFELLVSRDFDVALTVSELFGRDIGLLLDSTEHARLSDKIAELDVDNFVAELRKGLFRTAGNAKNHASLDRFRALLRGFEQSR